MKLAVGYSQFFTCRVLVPANIMSYVCMPTRGYNNVQALFYGNREEMYAWVPKTLAIWKMQSLTLQIPRGSILARGHIRSRFYIGSIRV